MANLPVPVPRTFVVAETEVAAYLNAVRDALTFLLNRPLLEVYQNAAQTVGTSAFTACSLDSTTVDSYGMHSNTTNNSRAVAQVAGWYTFAAASGWPAGSHGRGGSLFKNGAATLNGGTSLVQTPDVGGICVAPLAPFPVFLNVGDYIEWDVFQASGGNLATNNGGGQFCSYLTAIWDHT